MSKIAELDYISLLKLASHKKAKTSRTFGKLFTYPWNMIEQRWLALKRTSCEHKKWQEPGKFMGIHWGYKEITV